MTDIGLRGYERHRGRLDELLHAALFWISAASLIWMHFAIARQQRLFLPETMKSGLLPGFETPDEAPATATDPTPGGRAIDVETVGSTALEVSDKYQVDMNSSLV